VVYHTLTWLAWLCAAAFLALMNHQPLPTMLLIIATAGVFSAAGRRSALGQSWTAFLRLGLSAWSVALLFNLLSTHVGRIVLVALPPSWPLIGGPVTLEALLYGFANGTTLLATLLVFATFNLGIDQYRLLRWVPAGLYQAGLVVSVALAFVPHMVSTLKDIREAQRVRGHRFRGLRDLIPLFVPLITMALERSLTLAESIEARGFGGTASTIQSDGRASTTSLVGLCLLLAGLLWEALRPQLRGFGTATALAGVALLVLALYRQGQLVQRTRYRREVWRPRDMLVTASSTVSLLLLFYLRATNPSALWYYPFPPSSPLPTFSPLLGIAATLIAAPAMVWPTQVPRTGHGDARIRTAREDSHD
jgi:energy-coupling factor transport system permease protein